MQVTKYNASGNDFIIFHDREKKDRRELAKLLCKRQEGVGADGMVVLVPHPEYDFEWEFYNSDGSVATMCGNATRAVSHYAIEHGISIDGKCEFLTGAGVIRTDVNGMYVVTQMLEPKIIKRDIEEEGHKWWLIDTGVPHLVTEVKNIENFDLDMARRLREKYDANVNIYFIDKDSIRVRTYERGVEDETLACGTGIMASFVRAFEENKVKEVMPIYPKSGEELYMEYDNGEYKFGGRVSKVFEAEVTLDIPPYML
ncbi:MAG: diaminopimelate epimerase [Epsilonproteobacteria bacterium]|nr:diaminopimelate epimerase [Campylobacterota bacterium]